MRTVPVGEWDEAFAPDQQDLYALRLGNLTLLEVGPNRDVGNATYTAKAGVYAASAYHLTRAVAQLAPEEWTPALIDERQRRLAERATHLWRVDF